jgi:capsular exopolysaccharide synthesis family protein
VAYWSFLLRHKGIIFLSALAGLVLGFAIGIPMTPVFRARTSIEILNLNQDFMDMKHNSPVNTTEYSDEVSEEETQAQLIQGAALLNRVGAKLDPDAAHPKGRPVPARSGWRSWLHLPEHVEPTARQKLIGQAIRTLKVRVQPRTRVLELTTDSTSPQFAADFVNTLVQEFIYQSVEARLNNTSNTSAWLKQEIDSARSNLQRSEDALQAYARNSGLIFTDSESETNVATEKLQHLELSLSGVTADRISKESRYELAKNSPPDSLADVLNDEGLQTIDDKINETQRRLADLSAIYTPDYAGVKRAKAELASLQEAFQQKRGNILNKIETDYHQAQRNENLLRDAYLAQTREVTGQDEKTIQYNILKREVDSSRLLYDTMLQQMKQASIASALHASNLRVVDLAVPSDLPVSPNFKLNSMVGLFAGLILSISILTARERADRNLQMPGDIKQWLEIPELGTIPALVSSTKRPIYYRGTSGALGQARPLLTGSPIGSNGLVFDKPNQPDRVELVTLQHKSSLLAEAFRSALTSILFIGDNGNAPHVLVFTSTQPGDGKTTVVANLGIALAEIRKKTLIIDADMRRPSIHKVFGVPQSRGLSDLLQNEMTDENLAGLVQETGLAGLNVLTAGTPTAAAAYLLHSPNFAAFLEKVRPEYDMVLIDTPPMVQMTDARIVGRLSDAAVLVARAGTTTRDALRTAKERFDEDRTRVLGSILNSWDLKRAVGSYYYRQYQKHYATYATAAAEQSQN